MKNTKVFIIACLGCLIYFFILHEVFFIQLKIKIIFSLISCLTLFSSFYFLKKKKKNLVIITMLLYMLSFSTLIFLLPIFLQAQAKTASIFIISLFFIGFLFSLVTYFSYFIFQLYQIEKQTQDYIQQIEKEITHHYIHTLRHDYNENLYQIASKIKTSKTQEALDQLYDLMKKAYQDETPTISSSASLNHIFQIQFHQYGENKIPFRYYLCRIDDCYWNETYTLLIYQFLEIAQIKGNDVTLYLQRQNCFYICRIISRYPLSYKQKIPKGISITEKKIQIFYVYIIQMPLSS